MVGRARKPAKLVGLTGSEPADLTLIRGAL